MEFKEFAKKVNDNFNMMAEHTLYIGDVSKEKVWNTYLDSFPEGTNEIYRERREYDCTCCEMFVKRIGNVFAVIDGKRVSVWDIEANDEFKVVAKAISDLIHSANIRTIFLHEESIFGKKQTTEILNGHIWNHFWCKVPDRFISSDFRTRRSEIEASYHVFKSGLENISVEALQLALDLIEEDIVYKGNQSIPAITNFLELKNKYLSLDDSEVEIFIWENINIPGSRIKNDAIGTFLIDLSSGVDTTDAVNKFGKIMDPANYKQTKSIATPKQKAQAFEDIVELGYESALQRRHATLEDVSVNNVIYADRTAAEHMKGSLADILLTDTSTVSVSSNIEEISFDEFKENILPKATSVELLFENSQQSQLVSLIAPDDSTSKNMLNWNNNFSWSYVGGITDSSMKKNVEKAGGSVTGELRFSIQWNEENLDGRNDLDAHCITPNHHIYYGSKNDRNYGELDVDITSPASQTVDGTAVENITWQSKSKMVDGTYKFYVNNYSGRNSGGFRAEIEIEGTVYEYDYSNPVGINVQVAMVTLKDGEFSISHNLVPSKASKEVFNINSEKFHKVQTIMYSPNFWDDQKKGQRHVFFSLEDCLQPDSVRGIYNEFLKPELIKHRKTFDFLASKFRCPYSEKQITGLGFSRSDQSAVVRVSGKRQYKIKFKQG